jgi:hypothetical protein
MTPEQCLDQVWQILTACGINAGGPPGTDSNGWFSDLPHQAQAEIYETTDQTLTWTYVRPSDAAEAARMTIALLCDGPVSAGPPCEAPGLLLRDKAARLLQAAGLAALPFEFCYQAGESYPELLVIDPAVPSRGIVRITGDGDIFWEFRPAAPGSSGLDPHTAARAITAALGQAHSGHGADGTAT